MRVLADTNVLIDYTKGVEGLFLGLLEEAEKGTVEVVISPVNVAEFLNDKYLNSPQKLEVAKLFLDRFATVEVDREIGEVAGQLMRSNMVGYLGDALIAATCLSRQMVLLTRNRKHFVKIKELKLYAKRRDTEEHDFSNEGQGYGKA